MIKNKALYIKNYFKNIFKSIKILLKTFKILKQPFVLTNIINEFLKIVSKTIFQIVF